MMKKLLSLSVINSMCFYLVSLVLPSIKINGLLAAAMAGIILALLNISIRPVIVILTFPINILTFGLLTLVVNAWMVMITDGLVGGLNIPGFWLSFSVAVLISLISLMCKRLYKGSYQM